MNSGITEIAAFRIIGALSLHKSSYISTTVSESPNICFILYKIGNKEHTQILFDQVRGITYFDVNHSPLCIRIAVAVIYSLISSGVKTSQIFSMECVA